MSKMISSNEVRQIIDSAIAKIIGEIDAEMRKYGLGVRAEPAMIPWNEYKPYVRFILFGQEPDEYERMRS